MMLTIKLSFCLGGMENYFCINWKFSIICCMSWIPSLAGNVHLQPSYPDNRCEQITWQIWEIGLLIVFPRVIWDDLARKPRNTFPKSKILILVGNVMVPKWWNLKCVFPNTERSTISREVGSRVILPCKTESNVTLVQLTWKTNGVTLFSFKPPGLLHSSNESTHRNINITDSPPKALLIENVQESHAGNYTCEFNTDARFQEQRWELIITGELIQS